MKKKIFIILGTVVFLTVTGCGISRKNSESASNDEFTYTDYGITPLSEQYQGKTRKLSRLERKADKAFTAENFDKAMNLYEEALSKEEEVLNQMAMRLKIARLYFLIRDYEKAVRHFEIVADNYPELMFTDDVCDYIDALRFLDERRRAEAVCLNYAHTDMYSKSVRFINILNALSLQHEIFPDPAYKVDSSLEFNTYHAEYWISYFADNLYYAKSYSLFNDPNKVFFHRNHFYNIDDHEAIEKQEPSKYSDYLRYIPADMQVGPLSFSPESGLLVTTGMDYKKRRVSVELLDPVRNPFSAKLYYSTVTEGRRRFSSYRPLPFQQEEYSYAHPFLFNSGKSMLFSSNMSGGYGGMDLYIVEWNEETQEWGTPENLGPAINSAGDEIFPYLTDTNLLIFASNGLKGYGGLDLYYVGLDNVQLPITTVPSHFPNPINSEFNDYAMMFTDSVSGYFASDRNIDSGDDIFRFAVQPELVSSMSPFSGMAVDDVVKGGVLLVNDRVEKDIQTGHRDFRQAAPEGVLATIYFDFDSDELTEQSIATLDKLFETYSETAIDAIELHGYADQIGREFYNVGLSERRARSVERYLRRAGVTAPIKAKGLGVMILAPETIGVRDLMSVEWSQRVYLLRGARRVDIYNVKK